MVDMHVVESRNGGSKECWNVFSMNREISSSVRRQVVCTHSLVVDYLVVIRGVMGVTPNVTTFMLYNKKNIDLTLSKLLIIPQCFKNNVCTLQLNMTELHLQICITRC